MHARPPHPTSPDAQAADALAHCRDVGMALRDIEGGRAGFDPDMGLMVAASCRGSASATRPIRHGS